MVTQVVVILLFPSPTPTLFHKEKGGERLLVFILP